VIFADEGYRFAAAAVLKISWLAFFHRLAGIDAVEFHGAGKSLLASVPGVNWCLQKTVKTHQDFFPHQGRRSPHFLKMRGRPGQEIGIPPFIEEHEFASSI
jgi:hypothetical protein